MHKNISKIACISCCNSDDLFGCKQNRNTSFQCISTIHTLDQIPHQNQWKRWNKWTHKRAIGKKRLQSSMLTKKPQVENNNIIIDPEKNSNRRSVCARIQKYVQSGNICHPLTATHRGRWKEMFKVNALSRILRVLFINNNCLLINTIVCKSELTLSRWFYVLIVKQQMET